MNEKQFEKLLTRYLQGKCSPEENALVTSWIDSLAANENANRQDDALDLLLNQKLKKEIGISIVSETEAADNVVYLKRSNRRHQWWWAAAAILILAVGMFLLNSKQNRSANARLAKADSVQPGRNVATLTLADGKTIYLDDAADGRVAIQNGVEIVKNDQGITYKLPQDIGSASAAEIINTVTTPRGGSYKLQLPDGSIAWLNAASSIQFPAIFTDKNRTVSITGEVYFEIVTDKNKPFHVHASEQTIEVLGTHFNVNVYPDEAEKKTTLLEGSVRISNDNGVVRMLKPGEQAVAAGEGIRVVKAETDMAVAWTKGDFIFENTPLRSAMQQIGRWYNVDIAYEGDVSNVKFGGAISRTKSIKDVLNLLETTGVHLRLDGRKVLVKP